MLRGRMSDGDLVIEEVDVGDTEANAALIDAAPAMLDAIRAMVAWDEAEKRGPDYGSLTRDTHPMGEEIWRRWWGDQQALCRHAFDTAHAALARAESRP